MSDRRDLPAGIRLRLLAKELAPPMLWRALKGAKDSVRDGAPDREAQRAIEARNAIESLVAREGSRWLTELRQAVDEARDATVFSIWLSQQLAPPLPLPAPGGWAATPRLLTKLLEIIASTRPETVVELGSGLSTVVLGHLLRQSDRGCLISLDHDDHYGRQTRDMVDAHGLSELVEIRLAPLAAGPYGDWYSVDAVADIRNVDLLIVDGPPGMPGELSRRPAVPAMIHALSSGATVVLDDANRPDEAAIVRTWVSDFGLRLIELDPVGKGIAVLRKT